MGLYDDFGYCIAKGTFNGSGSTGASGDLSAIKCVIDRTFDKAAESKPPSK